MAAADIVVLKVQPFGRRTPGTRRGRARGLPVVVSSALETSVGIAAGLTLAAALPDLPYACGWAPCSYSADVCSQSLLPVDGAMPVRRPEPDLLDAVQADVATTQRWRERLAAARDS
ncbi:MAG: hypothetical protein H0T85_11300 [Geodermatophilaceae bacterium]|nr:hypothetical protein [Geodermatophilaceae bacterium]